MKFRILTLLLVSIIILGGCSGGTGNITNGSEDNSYFISGKITNTNNEGISKVRVNFDEEYGYAETDSSGNWQKIGLEGELNVIPDKDGYSFYPVRKIVDQERENIEFIGFNSESLIIYRATESSSSEDYFYINDINSETTLKPLKIKISETGRTYFSPDISSNQEKIVYTNNLDNNIYIYNIITEEIRLLISNDNLNDYPSFSPDDNKIVFNQINRNELYISDINGENLVKIADDALDTGYWVNDSIYYSSNKNNKYQIYKYNVANQKNIQIYEDNKRISSPLVLSDESILFFHLEDGNIYSKNIDGTGIKSQVTNSGGISSYSLTLSPGETKLAFRYDGEIYYINLDDKYPKSTNNFNRIVSENYHKDPQEPNWF